MQVLVIYPSEGISTLEQIEGNEICEIAFRGEYGLNFLLEIEPVIGTQDAIRILTDCTVCDRSTEVLRQIAENFAHKFGAKFDVRVRSFNPSGPSIEYMKSSVAA